MEPKDGEWWWIKGNKDPRDEMQIGLCTRGENSKGWGWDLVGIEWEEPGEDYDLISKVEKPTIKKED